jgi:lipopolysaccharide/colanic/teichoic acid biosynthesis glycosyltransferase
VTALEALKQRDAAPVPVLPPPVTVERPSSRWWQVAVAALGFALLLPVSAVIAVAIRVTSRGPVLYRGVRIGRGLVPFTIYKFRTLMADAEQRIGARLLTPGDPVYTPIGRFLKRYKLDEIPQLLNVMRGDMNLVGPRPIRPIFLATAMRDIPHYAARFAVNPGMTGLAQLRGGYFTPPRDKLRYDRIYIRRRTAWLDVKLVVATFVKLVNHWLTLGLLLGLVFFSVSFAPDLFRAPFEIAVGGLRLSPVDVIGVLLAAVVLIRQIPAHRLYLYRAPTNWPMAGFVLFTVLVGLGTGELGPRLVDATYFSASGFLLFFLIVSGEITDGFAIRATRVVALTAVVVALLGILEIVVETQGVAGGGESALRVTATLGSPVVLAAYLVLGMPLVLVELTCAERREERDFWLVCTTLLILGVLLTQTRTGLVALWLTGSVFFWRISRRVFHLFSAAALVFVAGMIGVGGFRLSPASLAEELGRRVAVVDAAVSSEPTPLAFLIGPEPGKGAVTLVDVGTATGTERHLAEAANMHLTLMLRTGLVGWALMMWVIGAALAAMYRGSRVVESRRLSLVLWAIFSSGVGFLVSMTNFNAFYNSSVQALFWGLLGIGMAIVIHRNDRRPAFNVIWRFGPRD